MKFLDVFTKSYTEETAYREFLDENREIFLLTPQASESIDNKIDRLRTQNFSSNFSMKIFDNR